MGQIGDDLISAIQEIERDGKKQIRQLLLELAQYRVKDALKADHVVVETER